MNFNYLKETVNVLIEERKDIQEIPSISKRLDSLVSQISSIKVEEPRNETRINQVYLEDQYARKEDLYVLKNSLQKVLTEIQSRLSESQGKTELFADSLKNYALIEEVESLERFELKRLG